ncbi:hypothetical protein ABPG74_016679 [Tetrahymena malaccensis]
MSNPQKQEINTNPIDQSIQQVFSQNDDDDIKKAIEKQKQPRCFTKSMKDQCWNNATIFIGRHPDRWRLDAVGNPVLRGLTSCLGPLCHEYDHIVPFSKGGKTEIKFDSIERAVYGDILKVDAEQQVKEASKQSLKILYAQKEIDQLQQQEQRMTFFDQNLKRNEENSRSSE